MAAARAKFTTLYEENYDAVHAFCARRVGHDSAADATAEVFAVVWRRIDEIGEEAAKAWLFGVARGVVLNRWRSKRRGRRLLEKVGGLGVAQVDGPETVVVRSEESATVVAALNRLRESDRDVLVMAAWDELTAPQIASVLGISTSAAEQRIHRAKKRLARELKSAPDPVRPQTEEGGWQ